MATTGTNMFFQLKVRLNIHISLTGMSHQMVFIFCAHILLVFAFEYSHFYASYFEIESAFEYSHQLNIAWHSRKITVA